MRRRRLNQTKEFITQLPERICMRLSLQQVSSMSGLQVQAHVLDLPGALEDLVEVATHVEKG
jgi:hypothetical protein